jgi:hypothetical protein
LATVVLPHHITPHPIKATATQLPQEKSKAAVNPKIRSFFFLYTTDLLVFEGVILQERGVNFLDKYGVKN